MTRCDSDAVFYRVLSITLLAIAFTFTIILTNVFVDIDGLLSSKGTGKHIGVTDVQSVINQNDITTETAYNDEMVYEEADDTYRNKRSLESQNILFHIKDPKMKTVLNNRLAKLLEGLDEEETVEHFTTKTKKIKEVEKDKNRNKDGDMLHLALHNKLLKGIIGHMEMNEVSKRLRQLINRHKSADTTEDFEGVLIRHFQDVKDISNSEEERKSSWKTRHMRKSQVLTEEGLFKELFNCKHLEDQIIKDAFTSGQREDKNEGNHKGPRVLIKTLIDITSSGNDLKKQEEDSSSNENVKGIIKLIYNGKNVKFGRADDGDRKRQKPIKLKLIEEVTVSPVTENINKAANKTRKEVNDYSNVPKDYVNKFIDEYLKRFSVNESDTIEKNKDLKAKREKRDVKVKFENHEKNTDLKRSKADEDELYVEIETHFDSKGMKGEKKNKLIRNLIQKIQKAIHSDMEEDKNKKQKNLHVRKRVQNPLESKSKLVDRIASPYNDIIFRQINPIARVGGIPDTLSYLTDKSSESWKRGISDYVSDKSGESWKKRYLGPGFLTLAKSLNSAELSEVDVDYNKVMTINGIPQRLQKPLNTDNSEEPASPFYDLSNIKFFIKDIDGTGFSIGFNQFVDEPPDPESIKLFSGIENIINAYQNEPFTDTNAPKMELGEKINDGSREESKTDDHIMVRRSVEEKHDHHSNEYKIIFDNNFLPYDSYQEIYEKSKSNTQGQIKKLAMPFMIDENILDRKLKPAEIFGLANLFQRKKRSVNVKKISNIKRKMKLNRFLNTHTMAKKRIYMNNKRSKRQINKIRIIATDLPHVHRHSDENIYYVSNENVFADRAIVRDMEPSHEIYQTKPVEQYEYVDEDTPTPQLNLFDGRSRHNALSSKYPHIFLDEISKSTEANFGLDNTFLYNKLLNHDQDIERNNNNFIKFEPLAYNATEAPSKIEQVLNSLVPPKSNIKVTVKVMPKNGTGLNSGFKEIHTSINKSYNKDGLLYSSLVNVSEISKVTKLNKTDSLTDINVPDAELSKTIKEQQQKMQFLLRQHKNHLDDQLKQLNEEKIRLESMFADSSTTNATKNDFLECIMPTKGNQLLRVKTKVNDVALKNPRNITLIGTNDPVSLKIQDTKPQADPVKTNMIKSMERNENLTHQVLEKIEKNTQMLEVFLKKITDTVVSRENQWKEDSVWTNPEIDAESSIVDDKNNSHVAIPFVYAYKHKKTDKKTDNVASASVIYHGHIHTNALVNQELKPVELKKKTLMKPKTNQTRFFIDDLENDYKVLNVRDVMKGETGHGNNTVT